jgi:phenylalanine-4-hydroxylase
MGQAAHVDFSANAALAALPDHLRQFAVDQQYEHYTPIDHAVWRFIMRQNRFFLKEYAHKLYFRGLLETGISSERIPRIEEMNEILSRIGWGAVAVDGFIPPAAFMEFQAYRVLVIACDMRQIHHIDYTPTPDIVHEAAGHAPIIVDREYAAYLQRFGEVGAKAMSSLKDFELYEAIRHLSILKEVPGTDEAEIKAAEELVAQRQRELGEPSEMALISRLHWWTVEYGLIGSLENPKIYGAGLLSSIGESVTCLESSVKKLPYSIETANYPFDITTRQPHLFVTPNFEQLSNVLDEFASTMAFQTGGQGGMQKAIDCHNVATCVYSSGLQVSGVVSEILTNSNNEPIYLQTKGPTALAFNNRQLDGHGKEQHADGFGSPIGKLKTPRDISEIREGPASLEFDSGIKLNGHLDRILRRDGKIIVLSFSSCTVSFGDRILFQPEWGVYDLAVGERIVSVFNGAADKTAYHEVALIPRHRTIKVPPSEANGRLGCLYQQVREIRESRSGFEKLEPIWRKQHSEHPNDWLLSMEIFEILDLEKIEPKLQKEIELVLRNQREKSDSPLLIDWGFRLVEYHNSSLQSAA